MDPLTAVKLPPGVYRNGTKYQAKGRWYDSNLIRFIEDTIQPIGGWRTIMRDDGSDLPSLTGVPRANLSWRSDAGDKYTGLGTTQKLYVFVNGVLFDVTPVGFANGSIDSGYVSGAGAYNFGPYGVGLYGVGSSSLQFADADTWQLDTFGQWLVATCTSDKKLYVWAGNTAVVAAVPAGAPANVRSVVVTPERFLFALGCTDPLTGLFNARRVAWPSQESTTDWTPTIGNTAGDFNLQTNGRLLAGRRTRGATLLWTDTDLWSATYIGGPLLYRFDQVADKCGLIAPNAMAMVDGRALWMGTECFFGFDGYVKAIPCDVADYVFSNLNRDQRAKIFAVPFAEWGEVWWFYPSSSSTECDRYVINNYREGHWAIGQLARSCGTPAGATDYPILCDSTGLVWEHEVGTTHTGLTAFLADGRAFADGSLFADGLLDLTFLAETPYVESGPVELEDGDRVMGVRQLVPDARNTGDVAAFFLTALDPLSTEVSHGPYTMVGPTSVRFSGRQIRMRIVQAVESAWRIGQQRLRLAPKGRR